MVAVRWINATLQPPGEAAAEVSRALNLPRKPLYRRALEMQGR